MKYQEFAWAKKDIRESFLRYMIPRLLIGLVLLVFIRLYVNHLAPFGPNSGGTILLLLLVPISYFVLKKCLFYLDQAYKVHHQEISLRLDYEKLFKLSYDLNCIMTTDGKLVQVNDSFFNILGFSPVEALGQNIFDFIHPDDRERTKAEVIKISRAGVPSINFECRYISKNGAIKHLTWNSTPVINSQVIFAVARDLTESKLAEEELRRAHEFSEIILENVPNMIFVKDAQELKFLMFNKAGEELLGFPRRELIGKSDFDFFTQEEAEFFTCLDRKVLQGREVVEIPEEEIHTKVNGKRLLRTKKIPFYNTEGHPKYLIGISEDITDVKRLHDERQQMEFMVKVAERISKLIHYSLDAVIATDDEGFITAWNEQAETIFGWDTSEAIGQKLSELLLPENFRMAYQEGLTKFIATGIGPYLNHRMELLALNKEQKEFPIEISITPVKDQSRWLFYAFARDITDRKRFEEQQKFLLQQEHLARDAAEKSLNMRDDFLSIAAHELRTPITPIYMSLQLIERSLSKIQAAETQALMMNLLKTIQNSKREVERLTKLIEELLDVTRISGSRLVLNFEDVNISEMVHKMIERYGAKSLKAGSTINSDISPHIVAHCDESRISSVVENLITNAIKYGEGKAIDVELSTHEHSIVLRVKDRGIGISEEDQKRIFNKFVRAVSVKRFSGLGLGLYITRNIVEAHGGSIHLKSCVGEGSTFTVELPLKWEGSSL